MLNQVVLHDPAEGGWLEFKKPLKIIIAMTADEVVTALLEVERATDRGYHAAGYLGYEAAPAFDSAFQTLAGGRLPLLVMGIFDAPRRSASAETFLKDKLQSADCVAEMQAARNGGQDWSLDEDYAEYVAKIDRIRREIGRGSIYQTNYTVRLQHPAINAAELFIDTSMDARFGAFLDFEAFSIVSASPELFFRLDGDQISTCPMKGTAERGLSASQDDAQRGWLESSEKNRAENLMITDMVRNDLGRIAVPGSVRTEKLFEVHRLPTVWQMTSTVNARTDASLTEIFGALFPGASVTGAPKIASMAVIAELERLPREIYTGAIGYVGPDSPRRKAQFSLAIRTAWVDKASQRATYGVGGGIVWDSTAAEEYAEIRTKTRVLERDEKVAFELLETMLWLPEEGFRHRDLHLRRVASSAEYFGIPLDVGSIAVALERSERSFAGQAQRVRLLIDQAGQPRVEAARFVPEEEQLQAVMLAREPVDIGDVFLHHKTTRRNIYQQAFAGLPEAVEPLLWNKQGLVTESVIANLVFSQQGRLYTPPISSGLLPGTLRQKLLEEGRIEERELPIEALPDLEALYLISSLRGWRRAELISSL